MSALSDAQLADYQRDGFVIINDAFSATEIMEMRAAADRMLELLVNSSFYHRRPSRRLDLSAVSETGRQVVRKVQPVYDLSLTFARQEADPRLQQPLQQLIGDKPQLMEEKLNYKMPLMEPLDPEVFTLARPSSGFPIHSDYAYYKQQNYPASIVSTIVSIDASTPDNGPVKVWPGTHRQDLPHDPVSDGGLQVRQGLIDPTAGQALLLRPGSVLFFSSLLVHDSQPNCSDQPRRVMIYSHAPISAGIPFDVRNGPRRRNESPYEVDYLQAVAEGRASAFWRAPDRQHLTGV